MIEFTTAAHEQAYLQVKAWVSQLFGESAWASEDSPAFTMPIGLTRVRVGIQSYGDHGACLDFFTWPLAETRLPRRGIRVRPTDKRPIPVLREQYSAGRNPAA